MKIQLKIVLLFFTFLTTNFSFSQVVKFENIYGGNGYDYSYSVCQTFDIGYAIVGSTTSFGNGSTDAYLLKVDSLGVAQWHKTFGGINIDQAYSIKETKDSGLVIAGFTNSIGNGGYDMYVIKTDKYGNTEWEKTYGGNNWDFAYSIDTASDGGYIITGGTYSFGKGNEDMYLVKINSVGDTLWTKTFGGTNEDEARSVKQTSDGGYILTGFTKSLGNSNGDIYTIKTNYLGDTLWTNKYGGSMENIGYDILESNTGGYIIGGKTNNTGGSNFNGITLQISSGGNYITSDISFGGSDDDGIYSIAQSSDGRLAKVGYTYSYGSGLGTSDFFLHIFNASSAFLNGPTFGGNKMEKAYCVNTTKDGGYIICGYSDSYSILDHIYLIKTDSNGVSTGNINVVTTEITSITKSIGKLNLFPNPANDNVYLSIEPNSIRPDLPLSVSIRDVLGRIYSQELITNTNKQVPLEINTEFLKNGIYIIHINSSAFSENIKLIVQH